MVKKPISLGTRDSVDPHPRSQNSRIRLREERWTTRAGINFAGIRFRESACSAVDFLEGDQVDFTQQFDDLGLGAVHERIMAVAAAGDARSLPGRCGCVWTVLTEITATMPILGPGVTVVSLGGGRRVERGRLRIRTGTAL